MQKLIDVLKKIKSLHKTNDPKKDIVHHLFEIRKQNEELSNPPSLDKTKINILKLLYTRNKLTSEQISNALSLQLQIAINHLEELEKLDMVFLLHYTQSIFSDDSYGSSPSLRRIYAWTIRQAGKKYLLDNKIKGLAG
jgi:hypothetical protein